ncbi:probable 6-phosphogluconolactonase 4, chloroplastic [Ziziphus jujuba]|uniref:Probable 6-phosphogluconolactonase n=2 Tax=Ziziphus jujuba TaxID=326968 RepID=A0A6P3ZTE0_ZIZJJ|nr:probable 6-phosphogluconolactonase 4, chloroplastic [Ziziphus jujuba]KAH7538295.1 hypothetical protein FEM48_Zijuj03G0184300 [Ziziphus jujuba var. spinosa]
MASSSLSLPTSLRIRSSHFPYSRSVHAASLSLLPPTTTATPSLSLTLKAVSLTRENLVCRASSSPSMAAHKKVEVFDTKDDLAVSLAKYTADLSEKFTKERGSFTVVLSGGSLISYLSKLVEPPLVDSVDWSKWHVFWVDERVVPKDHEDSNYKLAYDGFLSKVSIPTGNVYAINDALSAEGAADDYETCLRHLVKNGVLALSESGFPKFDLQLLGMGPDGHIASLFPGHPLLNEKEKWVTFIKDSPKPPPERITFTYPVINASSYIAMVVTGVGKSGAVQTAFANSGTLPVESVLPEGELTWFLDKNAAPKL